MSAGFAFSSPNWLCSCGHCNRSGFTGAPLRGTAAPDVHHAGRHKNRRPSPSFWTGHAWSHARWVSPYCWEISSVLHKWTSQESKKIFFWVSLLSAQLSWKRQSKESYSRTDYAWKGWIFAGLIIKKIKCIHSDTVFTHTFISTHTI